MEAILDLTCNLCGENYSDSNSPRNFKCGHSVCSLCLEKIINNMKCCPECRTKVVLDSVDDFEINYPILRLSRINAFANLDKRAMQGPKFPIRQPDSDLLQNAGTCPAHTNPLFFMCLPCNAFVCRDCVINDHPDPPRGLCVIFNIQEAMNKIKKTHLKVFDTYLNEAETSRKKLEYIVRGFSYVLKYWEKRHNSKVNNDFINNSEVIRKQKTEMETQLATLKELTESMRRMRDKMEEATSWDDIQASANASGNCESDFEKRAPNTRDVELQLFLHSFLNGKKNLEELGKTGKPVYAVLDEDGKSKYSELVFKKNHIRLHSLRDGHPPANSVILPFEAVSAAAPADCPEVFMRLGWGEGSKTLVFIRMLEDTPRGRQCVLLCTGELGPSYRNTLLGFSPEDNNTSHLKGGDYENNNGTGGEAIVGDIIDDEIYEYETGDSPFSGNALLAGWPPEERWRLGSFIFYIYPFTRKQFKYVYGIVTIGSSLLQCIKHNATKGGRPKVVDCGLVIPHNVIEYSDIHDDSESDDDENEIDIDTSEEE